MVIPTTEDHIAGHPRHQAARAFRILYVCTGNLCRSPFAEILTAHLMRERIAGAAAASFHISSAGTHAVAGASIHPVTRDELRTRGLDGPDVDRFRTRPLDTTRTEWADLILGASPRHRSAAVACTPAALSTAFSLLEFVRLAASIERGSLPADPLDRAAALVQYARRHRGMTPPADPGADDVPDPVDGSRHAHRHSTRLVEGAVRTLVELLAPPLQRADRVID